MKRSRFSEEKIVSILREAQGGMKVKNVCARHNTSEQTYYDWKRKCGVVECRSMSCEQPVRWPRNRAQRDSQP